MPRSPVPQRSSLERAFDSPDDKRRYVRRLFATIATRYDLITRLLSFGLDERWKRRLVAFAGGGPGVRALDLACGTGDLAQGLSARGSQVTGLDITPAMLDLARQKPGAEGIRWVAGDMTALPVRSASMHIVTTGYGLRNVSDLPGALSEIYRVLADDGCLASLDFNRPESPVVRGIYLSYLTLVGGVLGWLLHRDSETYRYIPASIERYPGALGVARMMEDAGFSDVRIVPVLGGLMAIHLATRRPIAGSKNASTSAS